MYDTLIQERGLINQQQTTTATSWLTESVLCTHGLQDGLAVSPREHLQRSESLLGHIDKLDHLKLRAHTHTQDWCVSTKKQSYQNTLPSCVVFTLITFKVISHIDKLAVQKTSENWSKSLAHNCGAFYPQVLATCQTTFKKIRIKYVLCNHQSPGLENLFTHSFSPFYRFNCSLWLLNTLVIKCPVVIRCGHVQLWHYSQPCECGLEWTPWD